MENCNSIYIGCPQGTADRTASAGVAGVRFCDTGAHALSVFLRPTSRTGKKKFHHVASQRLGERSDDKVRVIADGCIKVRSVGVEVVRGDESTVRAAHDDGGIVVERPRHGCSRAPRACTEVMCSTSSATFGVRPAIAR